MWPISPAKKWPISPTATYTSMDMETQALDQHPKACHQTC